MAHHKLTKAQASLEMSKRKASANKKKGVLTTACPFEVCKRTRTQVRRLDVHLCCVHSISPKEALSIKRAVSVGATDAQMKVLLKEQPSSMDDDTDDTADLEEDDVPADLEEDDVPADLEEDDVLLTLRKMTSC